MNKLFCFIMQWQSHLVYLENYTFEVRGNVENDLCRRIIFNVYIPKAVKKFNQEIYDSAK